MDGGVVGYWVGRIGKRGSNRGREGGGRVEREEGLGRRVGKRRREGREIGRRGERKRGRKG